MQKILSIVALLLLSATLPLMAEDKEHRVANRHELRLGWGDQNFEHLIWHKQPQPVNTLPTTYQAVYNENYRYAQHWFVKYQYRQTFWFSYGGLFDGSGVLWDEVTRNGVGDEISRDKNHSFYNLVFMPKVYFTYLYHPNVSLHSGIGFGLNINGGTEKDYKGRYTVVAPAMDLTLFGIEVCYKNWFAAADLGALISLTDGQHIYQLGSRMITVSIGRNF